MNPRRVAPAHLSLLLSSALLWTADAAAEESRCLQGHGPEEASEAHADKGEPDFLFGPPRGFLAVRGGWNFASADSEVFDFISNQLTVDDGDFRSIALGIDVELPLNPRLAAVFRLEYSHAAVGSEFRDYVDQDDNPITQETRLTRMPLTAGLKVYLASRGREVSRYAWVPHSIAPYVGGGGGFLWYKFQQVGDFVDFADLSIFSDEFISDGWAPTVQVFGGVHVKLSPRLYLTAEACYAWTDAELKEDFVGFDPIDLSGLSTTFGFDVAF